MVRAGGIVGKPILLYEVARKSLTKANKDSSLKGVAAEAYRSVLRLGRLVKAYASGDYREVSRKNIILVVAALLYFISPLDLIPDVIPFLGYADDMAVLGFILSTLGEELLKFEAFEEGRASREALRHYGQLVAEAEALDVEIHEGMSREELKKAIAQAS